MAAIRSPNPSVVVFNRNNVCWITFNRPDALNAINRDVIDALIVITDALLHDTSVRAVVLQGAGGHFMAGGDIKHFKERLDAGLDEAELKAEFQTLLDDVHHVIHNMRSMPQPILASVAGAVAGAGASVMMACDMVLASYDSVFTLAYCHLGVSPDGGSTYHLPRTVGLKRSFEIALLGDRFDAATVERWGLINRVVEADELESETENLARRLVTGPTAAHARAKHLLNTSHARGLNAQLEAETEAFVACTLGPDFAEGVDAFVNKRKPEFEGQ